MWYSLSCLTGAWLSVPCLNGAWLLIFFFLAVPQRIIFQPIDRSEIKYPHTVTLYNPVFPSSPPFHPQPGSVFHCPVLFECQHPSECPCGLSQLFAWQEEALIPAILFLWRKSGTTPFWVCQSWVLKTTHYVTEACLKYNTVQRDQCAIKFLRLLSFYSWHSCSSSQTLQNVEGIPQQVQSFVFLPRE